MVILGSKEVYIQHAFISTYYVPGSVLGARLRPFCPSLENCLAKQSLLKNGMSSGASQWEPRDKVPSKLCPWTMQEVKSVDMGSAGTVAEREYNFWKVT